MTTETKTSPQIQKRISIIKKLLNQASCPGATSAEAEAFMGKAQQMIEQFNISQAMLAEAEPGDAPAEIKSRVVYKRKKGKMPTWVLTLARGVADANRCHHWYSSSHYHGSISAAGTEDNLTTFELAMPFLVGEVDRLYKEEKPGWLDRSQGKRWATSFRNGASSRIAQRLREAIQKAEQEMRAQTPEERYKRALEAGDNDTILAMDREKLPKNEFALAKVETALAKLEDDKKRADEWVKENITFGRGHARNHYGTSSAGFRAGRAAGNRASLSGPKGRIGGQ